MILQIRSLAARAASSFVLSNESNTALLKHFSDLLPGILQVRDAFQNVSSQLRKWAMGPMAVVILVSDSWLEVVVQPSDCESGIKSTLAANYCNTNLNFGFRQVVNESCYQGDDSVLKSLVEIADTAPKYLRPSLEPTLQLCLKVRPSTRHKSCMYSLLYLKCLTNALPCLLRCVPTPTCLTCRGSWLWRSLSFYLRLQQPCWGNTQPSWLRVVRGCLTVGKLTRCCPVYFKSPNAVSLFVCSVPQMLAMMVDLEDDDEWAMADELEDDDFDR